MKKSTYIWQNGSLVNWDDAKVHVLTHALHYGTAVFEGIRAYHTDKGAAIFRAKEHFDRLEDSAKLIYMKTPYTSDELITATKHLIKENKLNSCYIRPTLFFGYGVMGLNPSPNPIETMIAAWEWGSYLGEDGLKNGIRCKMSSYTRIDSRTMPPLAKTSANYLNSGLAKQEALRCGYDEAILLNSNGFIAEGPGENLFVIKDKVVYATRAEDSALRGITADSTKTIAKNLGYELREKSFIRDEILTADELFFTGTAAEITPIREIDGIQIGNGSRGPITEHIQNTFFDVVTGKNPSYSHWLTLV